MAIMGVLSSFSVAASALIANAVLGADGTKIGGEIWHKGTWLVATGLGFLLVAAYFFYQQRSDLAWHYSAVAYAIARGDEEAAFESLDEVQGTRTSWRRYFRAHGFMVGAVGAFVLALLATVPSIATYALPLVLLPVGLTTGWLVVTQLQLRADVREREAGKTRANSNPAQQPPTIDNSGPVAEVKS